MLCAISPLWVLLVLTLLCAISGLSPIFLLPTLLLQKCYCFQNVGCNKGQQCTCGCLVSVGRRPPLSFSCFYSVSSCGDRSSTLSLSWASKREQAILLRASLFRLSAFPVRLRLPAAYTLLTRFPAGLFWWKNVIKDNISIYSCFILGKASVTRWTSHRLGFCKIYKKKSVWSI